MSVSGQLDFAQKHFSLSPSYQMVETKYMSRSPIPVDSYGSILKPFSREVWAATAVLMGVFATFFWTAHRCYTRDALADHARGLVRQEASPFNFFLYSFAKITEPDPLPWFKRMSSGKFVVLLWRILALFLVMCYNSNLRTHMMTETYEKPIDTLQDVVDNGKKVYIWNAATDNR